MGLTETIKIILQAEDRAEKVLKDNENNVKRFGDAAKQANQKVSQSSQLTQKQMESLSHHIAGVVKSTDKIGQGKTKFDQYTKSVNDSQIAFKRLDSETQDMLRYLSQMSDKGRETFLGMSSNARDAVSKFNEMKNATTGWNNTLDITKTKMQLAGTNVDSLKGKIQVVGNAIPQYLGSKWDSLKGKVSSFGGFIKSNLSSALSTVRSKIESLGNAFSGLGGIISSVFGGIGLAQVKDMTIGMSLNREQVKTLTSSVIGLENGFYTYWDTMDTMTNESLVSLDELGQAMSVIKMSTGANTTQLEALMPVVNDIGQRAILMGKSGEEAIGLMQSAGKGLNGEFEMLKDNFGVTKEKLMDMGWDGTAEDVQGYTRALAAYMEQGGELDDMMSTTSGKLQTLQKHWRKAGREIGDMFMPYLNQALDKLNEWTETTEDGSMNLAHYAIGVLSLASGFATVAPAIAPTLQVFDNMVGKTKKVLQFLGLMEAKEGALTLATLRESAAQKISAATKYLSGIATATYGAIVGVLTGQIGLATVAQKIWNAVMAANPIGLIIVAVAALAIAVYELGKMWGWWSDVGTMLDAIKAGLQRLWNAFINNPNVQGFIKGIGDAWVWLQEASKPVIDWLSGIWGMIFPQSATEQWDAVRIIIEGIGLAFKVITAPIQIFIGLLQFLYPYMVEFYNSTLVPFGEFLITIFTPAWEFLTEVIAAITPLVMTVSNAFTQFANGQMSLPGLITTVLTSLLNIYTTILTMIVNAVINWAVKIVNNGINAATRFVSGIIIKIASLPGKFIAYLRNIIVGIASAGASWVSTGISKASALVSGVINQVSQLPGKVYNEFAKIPGKIQEAAIQAATSATEFGQRILNAVLNSLGIHSPGIVQLSIAAEFTNTISQIADRVKSAYDTAKSMGEAIVDGFGNPSLETDTSNMLPNEDALKTSIGVQAELSHQVSDVPTPTATMDTSSVTVSNEDVIGSYDNLANMTGSALQSMVDKDKLAYESMRVNDANTLSTMTTNLQQKMGLMTNSVRTNMDNIVAKNTSSMNNVKNTTSSQLNSIVSKTKSANDKMIKSWDIMKEGIISAADKIRSDSTAHFDKLSNTIGTFYGKLKNPSRWGAGSPITRSKGSSSRGLSKLTSALRTANIPTYLSSNQIQSNSSILGGKFGDYITRDRKTSKFNVMDLLRYGAITLIGKGAGSYSSIPSPNITKIKDTSKEWDMKGPLVGKFQTNKGFKVKEFLTGVPKITYDVFRSIAEDVYGQTRYEFYYDNDHHGNWVNAFNAGSMNCLHGAESLVALANVMGLSGSVQHGHWTDSSGTYGHYFANIAGHKMDVTGWQQRRTWTPSASAGPAPKSYGFQNLIEIIKSILDDDPSKPSSSGTSKIEGSFTIIHDFKNLPEGVTAEEVAKMVEDSATNDNFIKKLVKNINFQNLDAEEKLRLENKSNRARGV